MVLPHDVSASAKHTLNSRPGVPDPFVNQAAGFFGFLRSERSLCEGTLVQYRHFLRRLQKYLLKTDRPLLSDLAPSAVTAFVTESGRACEHGCRNELHNLEPNNSRAILCVEHGLPHTVFGG